MPLHLILDLLRVTLQFSFLSLAILVRMRCWSLDLVLVNQHEALGFVNTHIL